MTGVYIMAKLEKIEALAVVCRKLRKAGIRAPAIY